MTSPLHLGSSAPLRLSSLAPLLLGTLAPLWVRVIRGPLAGLAGILIKKKGKHRLVVSIHLLKQSVAVEMDADSVIPLDWLIPREFCPWILFTQRTVSTE